MNQKSKMAVDQMDDFKENGIFFFFEGSTILCSSSVSMEMFVGGWYMTVYGEKMAPISMALPDFKR